MGCKNDQEKWSRLVRQPLKRGGHVIMDACTPKGQLKRYIISRSMGKMVYRSAKKAMWGDGYDTYKADLAILEKQQRMKRPWREMVKTREERRKVLGKKL